MSEPRTIIEVVRRSSDRLWAVVDDLDDAAIAGPSYCSEWSVAQVLSHLGSGAEIFSLFLEAAASGREPPGREAFPPIWDSWNAKSPGAQATDAERADRALVERLEGLDDGQLAALRVAMFGMDLDIAALVRMRLFEHTMHSWDVAVTRDLGAELAPDAVDLLVDAIGAAVPRLAKPLDHELRVRVRTSGPERDLLLVLGSAVSLTDTGSDGAADAELDIPSAALLRLVYGRLDPEHTPEATSARRVDLDTLRRVFPGF